MKQQIFDDICFKLDSLKIPYTLQDDRYIRVNTEFYDVGYNIEPKRVLYELSVCVDETARSVSMYVRTADEYLLASGACKAATTSSSIFRKVRHISFSDGAPGDVLTIDLGEVPNTVKNTAVKYGWKFSTALNLNRPMIKAPPEPLSPDTPDAPFAEPEPPAQACASPVTAEAAEIKPANSGFFKRLLKKGKYSPRH